MLQTLLNTPKIIRHIQRGTSNSTGFSGGDDIIWTKTISLTGFTNVDKMICILNGSYGRNNSIAYNDNASVFLNDLTTTKLILGITEMFYTTSTLSTLSYQVIEFA